jgi:signal transduction histidine kinase
MVTLELRCTAPSMTTDPLRAHCIVVNLLGNAVRHAALVGQRATVVGQIEVANGWIELTVEDSGSGVRTLDRAKIFEPTTRLHHTPGSGLGLHLVKTALADLKGAIDVQVSTSLGGARFKARWPEGGVG